MFGGCNHNEAQIYIKKQKKIHLVGGGVSSINSFFPPLGGCKNVPDNKGIDA